MTRKDIVARSAFTAWSLNVAALALFNSRLVGGWCFTLIMCVVSALVVADLIINDLLPERFIFKWALKYRKWTYTLASFSYASHLFVAEQSTRSVRLDMLVIYSSMAIFALLLSFRNLFHVRGRACSEH
jgi:hypothetical protein